RSDPSRSIAVPNGRNCSEREVRGVLDEEYVAPLDRRVVDEFSRQHKTGRAILTSRCNMVRKRHFRREVFPHHLLRSPTVCEHHAEPAVDPTAAEPDREAPEVDVPIPAVVPRGVVWQK